MSLLVEYVGTSTKTAANGDTLEFVYAGFVTVPLDPAMPFDGAGNPNLLPPPYRLEHIWDITGGTGRFAGASGRGTSDGIVVGDGTSFGIDTNGVISTVGSNKKR